MVYNIKVVPCIFCDIIEKFIIFLFALIYIN